MPRRASSSLHPGIIVGIAAALALAVYFGKDLMAGKSKASIEGEKLEVRDFLENGNSLRGNEYVVEGTIDRKLRWTSSRGQVVSLRVGTPGGQELIGVEVPPSLSKVNIEREQKYAMKVKFRQGGIPVATAISRL